MGPTFQLHGRELVRPRIGIYEAFGKRALDLTASAVGVMPALAAFGVAALVLRMSGISAPIMTELRLGRSGEPVKILKLRTVIECPPGSGKRSTTRTSQKVRDLKVDELGQVVNVLLGSMSLVGPRPLGLAAGASIRTTAPEILALRPGLTGAASLILYDEEHLLSPRGFQIEDYEWTLQRVKIPATQDYAVSVSFLNDVRIIIATLIRRPSLHDPLRLRPFVEEHFKEVGELL